MSQGCRFWSADQHVLSSIARSRDPSTNTLVIHILAWSSHHLPMNIWWWIYTAHALGYNLQPIIQPVHLRMYVCVQLPHYSVVTVVTHSTPDVNCTNTHIHVIQWSWLHWLGSKHTIAHGQSFLQRVFHLYSGARFLWTQDGDIQHYSDGFIA